MASFPIGKEIDIANRRGWGQTKRDTYPALSPSPPRYPWLHTCALGLRAHLITVFNPTCHIFIHSANINFRAQITGRKPVDRWGNSSIVCSLEILWGVVGVGVFEWRAHYARHAQQGLDGRTYRKCGMLQWPSCWFSRILDIHKVSDFRWWWECELTHWNLLMWAAGTNIWLDKCRWGCVSREQRWLNGDR